MKNKDIGVVKIYLMGILDIDRIIIQNF